MRIFQVDAFADRAFGGNPAGVCILGVGAAGRLLDGDPAWMQSVASEMNLSETAFLSPQGSGAYGLRWFTPAVEVDLCGHATLASAHVLWEQGSPEELLEFETRSGVLTAVRAGDGLIQLDFPADPPSRPPGRPEDRVRSGPGRAGSPGWPRRSAPTSWASTGAASTCWSRSKMPTPSAAWPLISGPWPPSPLGASS